MGAATEAVRRHVPSSYRAMIGATGVTDYYSLTQLQALADFVQHRLFATVPGASNEAIVWDSGHVELIGMLTTLQFIPAAVDYWADQLATRVAEGTRETESYPDRISALWKVFDKLQAEAAGLAQSLGVNVNAARAVVPRVSYGDEGRGVLRTEDPALFPREFRRRRLSDLVPWGDPTVV